MEDITLGFESFDQSMIVKTNQPDQAKKLFASAEVRETFESMDDFVLETAEADDDAKLPLLLLTLEDAVTEPSVLRKIYHAFREVLIGIKLA
jgi:hypothetical protein